MKPGTLIRPKPVRAAVLERRVRPVFRGLAVEMLNLMIRRGLSAVIADPAPGTMDELLDAWDGLGPVPVSGAHADRTVWRSPELNALFRAWHDSLHVELAAGFSATGEYVVAQAHARLVSARYREAMWAETFGQFAFQERHGTFPTHQEAFVRACLRVGLPAAVADRRFR
jgi:hypothetical protein